MLSNEAAAQLGSVHSGSTESAPERPGRERERCRIETSQDENSHLFSDLKEVSSHTY